MKIAYYNTFKFGLVTTKVISSTHLRENSAYPTYRRTGSRIDIARYRAMYLKYYFLSRYYLNIK